MTTRGLKELPIPFKKCKTLTREKWAWMQSVEDDIIAFMEAKIDGERRLGRMGECYTRCRSTVSGLYENCWDELPLGIQEQFARYESNSPGSWYDFELYVPGGVSSDVSSELKKHREGYLANLKTVFFRKMQFRKGILEEDDPDHLAHFISEMSGEVPERFDNFDLTYDELVALAADAKMEGFVIKLLNLSLSNFGYEWYKLKVEDTIDGVVTGTKEGDGKYLGLVGALKISVLRDGKLVEVASVSGMTDGQREEITEWNDRGILCGKVCEVRYQRWSNTGRLILPRFKRWRDDKPASECLDTWEP